MKYKEEYVIDRSKWVCGGGKHIRVLGRARLLNNKNRMCCLGQICSLSGVDRAYLLNNGSPAILPVEAQDFVPSFLLGNSDIARSMMSANDDSSIGQGERESKLKDIAKRACVKLTFKGRLLPLKKKKGKC